MTTFTGSSGNDYLPVGQSNAGNDVFIGKGGNDHITCGAGDDVSQFSPYDGFDDVQGGTGYDKVVAMANYMYIGFNQYGGAFSVEEVSANGFSGVYIKSPTDGAVLDFSSTTLTGITRIEGDAGSDIFTGSPGSDTITTLGGFDYINESGGSDTIDGGAGKDGYYFGQVSGSWYTAQQSATNPNSWTLTNTGTAGPSSYTVSLSTNGDRLVTCSNGSSAYTSNVEVLVSNGTTFGSSNNDSFAGGNAGDIFVSLAGDDTIDGGLGADTMIGGTGNDTYVVDNAGDAVLEKPGEGTDTVRVKLGSYTLGSDVENLTFIGSGAFTGTGNGLANAITGGASADTLVGGGGSDTLTGGAGADLFKYLNLGDSAVGSGDLIYDFSQAQADKIDLSALYAQSGAAFSFLGSAAFTGVAGQVRAEAGGDGNTHVFADMSGGGVAGMEVGLRGAVSLVAADFAY